MRQFTTTTCVGLDEKKIRHIAKLECSDLGTDASLNQIIERLKKCGWPIAELIGPWTWGDGEY